MSGLAWVNGLVQYWVIGSVRPSTGFVTSSLIGSVWPLSGSIGLSINLHWVNYWSVWSLRHWVCPSFTARLGGWPSGLGHYRLAQLTAFRHFGHWVRLAGHCRQSVRLSTFAGWVWVAVTNCQSLAWVIGLRLGLVWLSGFQLSLLGQWSVLSVNWVWSVFN